MKNNKKRQWILDKKNPDRKMSIVNSNFVLFCLKNLDLKEFIENPVADSRDKDEE